MRGEESPNCAVEVNNNGLNMERHCSFSRSRIPIFCVNWSPDFLMELVAMPTAVAGGCSTLANSTLVVSWCFWSIFVADFGPHLPAPHFGQPLYFGQHAVGPLK